MRKAATTVFALRSQKKIANKAERDIYDEATHKYLTGKEYPRTGRRETAASLPVNWVDEKKDYFRDQHGSLRRRVQQFAA